MTVEGLTPLTTLALLALVVFFFVPSRFLGVGHWALALLTFSFVIATYKKDGYFWSSLFGGIGLSAYWIYRKLTVPDISINPDDGNEMNSVKSKADENIDEG